MEKRSFYQDRLGTNIAKLRKMRSYRTCLSRVVSISTANRMYVSVCLTRCVSQECRIIFRHVCWFCVMQMTDPKAALEFIKNFKVAVRAEGKVEFISWGGKGTGVFSQCYE